MEIVPLRGTSLTVIVPDPAFACAKTIVNKRGTSRLVTSARVRLTRGEIGCSRARWIGGSFDRSTDRGAADAEQLGNADLSIRTGSRERTGWR